MIDKPLMQNPLAGGGAPQIIDPSVITPRGGGLGEISGIAFNPPKQEAPPLAEVYTNPATKQLLDDFGKSDFAKNVNHMQQDHMEIDLNGLPISGNGSYIGSLMQYLKSVGKDNMVSHKNLQKFEPLAQVPGQGLLGNSDPYTVNYGGMDIGPNVGNEIANRKPADPANLGSAKVGVNPIVSGPDTFEIATQQAPINPYNRVGQQLTGPNQFDGQFSSMGDRLTKLEEGIGSLLDRKSSSDFNSMQPTFGFSRYGYSPFSMVGLGSLFGGYYG